MNAPLSVPELLASDVEVLERRARELSTGSVAEDPGRAEDRLVSFRLCGRTCAVDARVVARVVARLSRPLPVPLQGGGERLVAFVEELPVPVVDLEGFASGAPRELAAIESPSGPAGDDLDRPGGRGGVRAAGAARGPRRLRDRRG